MQNLNVKNDVSICIANYNGIEIIDSCIASIYNQITCVSYEIIVHDDASTDDSVEYIRSKYPKIRVIQSKKNVGFCISNNRMVTLAKSKYVLLLNNDARLFPSALETLHTNSQKFSNSILGLPQYDAFSKQFIDAGSSLDIFLNSIPNQLKGTPQSVGMLTGACLWIPKALWDNIGGFPPIFETLAEDLYLCLKAHTSGYNIIVLQESGYYHMVGTTLGGGKIKNNAIKTSIKRRALTERNKIFVMCTFYPLAILLLLLPMHITLLLVEGIILSVFKNKIALKSIYLKAIHESWINRKHIMMDRKSLTTKNFIPAFKYFNIVPHKLKTLIKYGLPILP